MDDQGSESEGFSDHDGATLDLHASLDHIGKSTLKYLNYTTDYVRNWGLDEAFRESYQNWRDGILRSFRISRSQFRTDLTEPENQKGKKKLILIRAFNASTDEMLGFIRFQYNTAGNSVGGLMMANFGATLPYASLGTGATTKAYDSGQTGQHGEGMKLSALVFRRNNYNFRIESGGFKWNFIFRKGELACGLRRMEGTNYDKLKQKEKGNPRTYTARPWSDVCVIIGAPGRTCDINGERNKGQAIHVSDFRKMLKVTLDIDPPTKIVRTPYGDLIVDPRYQGQMYLCGLLLPSGGMSGKPYAYGYNFVNGRTTRDRDTLSGSGEESRHIAAIWASAIRTDESEDADLVTEYTNLLLNHLNKKGDAVLSNETNCLAKDVAVKVWTKMLTMNHSQKGRPAFYYSAIGGKDEVHVIEQSLNQNPIPLDLELWKIFRQFKICRTPGEELLHRFKCARKVDVPTHSFAMHVERMLKCLLSSSEATKHMGLTFVDGEQLRIDAGFFDNIWQIHNKWLTCEGAHETAFCEENASDYSSPFTCDHVVLQLWDVMISQLIASGEHPRVAAEEAWLKSMARARLSQMPRSVTCYEPHSGGPGELRVLWESVDSHRNSERPVRVVLHADRCTETAESHHQPRNVTQYLTDQDRKCTCLSLVSKAGGCGVNFKDLDTNKKYFPSVSRDTAGAFIALQPESMKPCGEATSRTHHRGDHSASNTPMSSPTDPTADSIPVSDTESTSDYNSEDDENDFDGVHDNASFHENTVRGTTSSTPKRSTRIGRDMHLDEVSRSPASTRAAGTKAAICAPIPKVVTRDKSTQTELVSLGDDELHVLGGRIEHRSLDWGGTFPGSHSFYRTRNAPDEDIFILKPKHTRDGQGAKRKADEFLFASSPGKRRLGSEITARGSTIARESPRARPIGFETAHSTFGLSVNIPARSRAPSVTSSPQHEVTYRY